MWKTHPVLIVLVAALVAGCSDDIGEPAPPSGGGTSYGACGAATPLQAGNVRAWINYVACLPYNNSVDEIRAEIDQHRDDDAIANELLDIIEDGWTPNGIQGDYSVTVMAIATARQMGNESVLARSEALVWRPLPPPEESAHFAGLEGALAENIACTRTRAGAAAAQRIIDSHPSPSVRASAADKLEDPICLFGKP